MSKNLDKKDLENIMLGATFLGAGGGGSKAEGEKLIEKLEENHGKVNVELVKPEEMSSDEYAVMIADIGAPRAFREKDVEIGPEAINAFEAIEKASYLGGKPVEYLMAGELGGFNTIVPMFVAAIKNIPFIDGDGNGRAVPELATGLYPIYDIPPKPLVLANSQGDTMLGYLNDPLDHRGAEIMARQISVGWESLGFLTAFATWPVNKTQILDCLAPNSISKCEKIGSILQETNNKNYNIENLSDKLYEELHIKELFIGKIKNLKTEMESGFDKGKTIISGLNEYKNETLEIDFKNENMMAKIGDDIVAMVPDLICLVDIDKIEPLTNADIEKGDKIAVYGLEAPKNWKAKPEGFECWSHILEDFGYTGEYISLE